MVSMWRDLLVDRPQTGIAIGENCDRSGFIDSASPQGKTDGAYRFGTSVAHKSKACGMPVTIQRLAGNDFKVPFRSLVSIPDIPTFIVQLRTVLAVACADKGRSSPRKSVTFRNGNSAAILAVTYRTSGVMGFLFVNSVEKLAASDPEQGHLLSRRIRMPTFPYTERRVDR